MVIHSFWSNIRDHFIWSWIHSKIIVESTPKKWFEPLFWEWIRLFWEWIPLFWACISTPKRSDPYNITPKEWISTHAHLEINHNLSIMFDDEFCSMQERDKGRTNQKISSRNRLRAQTSKFDRRELREYCEAYQSRDIILQSNESGCVRWKFSRGKKKANIRHSICTLSVTAKTMVLELHHRC